MTVKVEFTTAGNGTAFVRELDKALAALPPWDYGIDQVWDSYRDYREIQRIMGMAMRDRVAILAQDWISNNKPFVVEIFGELFGFASVPGGWVVGHLGARAEFGTAYIGLVDIIFSSVVTEAKHTRDVPDIASRAISVVSHEQTEETLQDVEYMQMCLFLVKRFVKGESVRQRLDAFVGDYIVAIGS